MELQKKLEILADAAKYDASCASGGAPQRSHATTHPSNQRSISVMQRVGMRDLGLRSNYGALASTYVNREAVSVEKGAVAPFLLIPTRSSQAACPKCRTPPD